MQNVILHLQKWIHKFEPDGHLPSLVQSKDKYFSDKFDGLLDRASWDDILSKLPATMPHQKVAAAIHLCVTQAALDYYRRFSKRISDDLLLQIFVVTKDHPREQSEARLQWATKISNAKESVLTISARNCGSYSSMRLSSSYLQLGCARKTSGFI